MFGAVLALHLLFAAVAWWEMRPRPVREVVHLRLDEALQLRFIESPRQRVPVPPPVVPPSPPAARPPPVHEAPRKDAMVARPVPATAPAPAPLRLYDRTGQPLLPAGAASTAAPTPGYVQRMPQGDRRVMHHDTPIKYHATRFESDFPPPDESLFDQGIRRALSATHSNENKSVGLGRGVHLKCKTLFGIPTPMCGMPPAPPSKKDGDERLNMAPAPLARELTPPKPELSECIARYRAGKPLPHGCPVDTPERSVDAECGEARREGKPLPAHCRKP